MSTRQSAGSLGQPPKVRRRATTLPFVEAPPLAASDTVASKAEPQSLQPAAANRKIRWHWGVLAALAMALISFYPQIDLWLTRGADWQGAYASTCYDEEVYAAYINGLLLGRPRASEPLGLANPGKPPHESLFSIQIVPAYLIVLLARAFGLTAVQAFMVLTPLIAFLSALALFYLLASVTRDEAWAALGALTILIFGTLAAKQSMVFKWIGWNEWPTYFPFLRRYQPAMIFPIFFGFMALTWQAFIGQGRQAWRAAIAAGAVFAVIVYSYFFLWTAAAAWLACFVGVWLLARPTEWPMLAKRLAPTALFATAALAVYAVLLSHRNLAMDKVQVLTFTHAPDFYRAPQVVSLMVILLLLWGVRQGRIQWREPVVLLTSSLALMPFAVFNQQLITGRSLQPLHYELFIANYVSLLALILTIALVWGGPELQVTRRWPTLLLIGLTCVVLGWGVAEVRGVTLQDRVRNTKRDMFIPVAKRLTALAAEHGQGPDDREVLFSPNIGVIPENLAASAPQAPLWGIHVPVAGGLSIEELQERYFQHLYYCGMRPGSLGRELARDNSSMIAFLFGYERSTPGLTTELKPLTTGEIAEKIQQYGKYVATFDRERARRPELSYVVLDTSDTSTPVDFSNLDRWYIRDKGEKIGLFTLYQVKLR